MNKDETTHPARYDVSLVIPVFNQWHLTEACLESIFSTDGESRLRVEIILCDDCSTDITSSAWKRYADRRWPLRYQRNRENLGYLKNTNAGVRVAQGRLLCLMNNDIIVQPGWLDALVRTMDSEPRIGVVGPKFVSKSKRTIEAGVVVNADGTGYQLGHGSSSDDPRFAYVNDVHYCSMACTLVRSDVFRQVGGYDERYAPCYYEDTDLCMSIWKLGYRVVVNPAVRIMHMEGGTHGHSAEAGSGKSYMLRNREIFLEKWRTVLQENHPSPAIDRGRMRSWKRGHTIVLHWPEAMSPRLSGGALRTWRMMLELRKRGLHVLLFCVRICDEDRAALWEAGIEVHRTWEASPSLLRSTVGDHDVVAVIFGFEAQERLYSSYYRKNFPEVIRIFDTVDLHFVRGMREVVSRSDAIPDGVQLDLRPDGLPEQGYGELASMYTSDVALVVSECERRILVDDLGIPAEKVVVASFGHESPPSTLGYKERMGFVFLGYFGHPPNTDCVEWIVREIWPLIRIRLPDAALHVYGSEIPDSISALDDPSSGVRIHGFVEDHLEVLAQARILLCPLRFGAGIKIKVIEALAVGTVVVTTRIGREGIDDSGEALESCEGARELAALAVRLHERQEEWEQRSSSGRKLVAERFSPAALGDAVLEGISRARVARTRPGLHPLTARMLHYERAQAGAEWLGVKLAGRSLVMPVLFPLLRLERRLKRLLRQGGRPRRALVATYDFVSLRWPWRHGASLRDIRSPMLRRGLRLLHWAFTRQLTWRARELLRNRKLSLATKRQREE